MSVLFEATEKFEKDLKAFQAKERERIITKINLYCSRVDADDVLFRMHAYRPHRVFLKGDFESTLYALRINRDIRVIMTLDDDPLFEQTIVTLLRVVRHDALEKAFRGVAESLYQSNFSFGEED